MRRILIAAAIVALLGVNWAALHDIVRGEADVRLEWLVVALSVTLFVAWGVSYFRKRAA